MGHKWTVFRTVSSPCGWEKLHPVSLPLTACFTVGLWRKDVVVFVVAGEGGRRQQAPKSMHFPLSGFGGCGWLVGSVDACLEERVRPPAEEAQVWQVADGANAHTGHVLVVKVLVGDPVVCVGQEGKGGVCLLEWKSGNHQGK